MRIEFKYRKLNIYFTSLDNSLISGEIGDSTSQ